jgi:hypothetical protein
MYCTGGEQQGKVLPGVESIVRSRVSPVATTRKNRAMMPKSRGMLLFSADGKELNALARSCTSINFSILYIHLSQTSGPRVVL